MKKLINQLKVLQKIKGYRTYKDDNVYFFGFSKKDWEEIINTANNIIDNDEVTETKITFNIEEKEFLYKLKVSGLDGRVIINCYKNNNNSYMQGKQSKLFEL